MNEALSFIIKDGLGLNQPIIKTADGDEIAITGMSYKDKGKNRKQLDVGPEMEDHYTEDFILFGVGGKKYCVTREVTIYSNPPKGGKFNSKIIAIDRISESVNRFEKCQNTESGYVLDVLNFSDFQLVFEEYTLIDGIYYGLDFYYKGNPVHFISRVQHTNKNKSVCEEVLKNVKEYADEALKNGTSDFMLRHDVIRIMMKFSEQLVSYEKESKMIKQLLSGKSVRSILLEANESDELEIELKKLETDDYQHRDGDYPRSGVPDTIDVFGHEVTFSFKNTSEAQATSWVRKFMNKNGFSVDKVSASQTGDYHDDWVDVYCTVKLPKAANESRKFVVGKNFIYTDKYGVTHDCTVKSRVENDDEFDPDYKIADMTYSYLTMGEPKVITVPLYRSEQRDSYGDEYFVSDRKNGIANWVFP